MFIQLHEIHHLITTDKEEVPTGNCQLSKDQLATALDSSLSKGPPQTVKNANTNPSSVHSAPMKAKDVSLVLEKKNSSHKGSPNPKEAHP